MSVTNPTAFLAECEANRNRLGVYLKHCEDGTFMPYGPMSAMQGYAVHIRRVIAELDALIVSLEGDHASGA